MNPERKKPERKKERPILPTGFWNMELLDKTVIQFYSGMPDENPLKTEPEFDKGDNWSIDADPELFGDNEFETDEDGFMLVPKDQVKWVYFKPYDQENPKPEFVTKTKFETITSKKVEVHCYNCGKEIPVGEPAVAVTAGTITEDGFVMDEDPWATIACDICGSQIHEVVGDLNRAFESLG